MRLSLILAVSVLGCATVPVGAASGIIELAPGFQLHPMGEGIWRHVSFKDLPGLGPFPSNGLVVLGPQGGLLIDTPWTPEQTRLLLGWIAQRGALVREVVITHAHDDRMGGVGELASTVRIHALPLTVERAAALGVALAAVPLEVDARLELAGEQVGVFFPGAGHAPDNVVVSLPSRGLLFGGCFVKAGDARTLGNVADADLPSWRVAIGRVLERSAAVKVVVPGHGEPGGLELLTHTRALVDAATAKAGGG
jgi:metallo-beta-lactamase class B